MPPDPALLFDADEEEPTAGNSRIESPIVGLESRMSCASFTMLTGVGA
jgi:hypothetical protein